MTGTSGGNRQRHHNPGRAEGAVERGVRVLGAGDAAEARPRTVKQAEQQALVGGKPRRCHPIGRLSTAWYRVIRLANTGASIPQSIGDSGA